MLSDFFKILRILYRVQQDKISYRELIEFLHNETPPEDHNFLRYDYTPYIESVTKFGSVKRAAILFSIIIPTYNRCGLLLKTINAVAEQKGISLDECELIIVDNGSKDGTKEAVESFAKRQKLRVVYIRLKGNHGADFARNVGVLHSRGRLLAFTDDDCIVPADWLFEFKRELDADSEISGVGGFKIPRSTREHLDIYHRFLMWGHFLQPHIRTKDASIFNHCGLTANVCYRREVFEKLGGFNLYFKHIGFEEFKIRLRKSMASLLYEPRMVEHFAYFTFGSHVLKLFPQGRDRYLLHKLHPNVWPNPSFLYFLKRTVHTIRAVFTSRKQPPLFIKSLPDIIKFSFLSSVTNFFLWLGKYWTLFSLSHHKS